MKTVKIVETGENLTEQELFSLDFGQLYSIGKIEYQGHQAFLIPRIAGENKTFECPICGEDHIHGKNEGVNEISHRGAHCRGTLGDKDKLPWCSSSVQTEVDKYFKENDLHKIRTSSATTQLRLTLDNYRTALNHIADSGYWIIDIKDLSRSSVKHTVSAHIGSV